MSVYLRGRTGKKKMYKNNNKKKNAALESTAHTSSRRALLTFFPSLTVSNSVSSETYEKKKIEEKFETKNSFADCTQVPRGYYVVVIITTRCPAVK